VTTTYSTKSIHVMLPARRDRYSSCGHRCQAGVVFWRFQRDVGWVWQQQFFPTFSDVYKRASKILPVCEASAHRPSQKSQRKIRERSVRESSRLLWHPCRWGSSPVSSSWAPWHGLCESPSEYPHSFLVTGGFISSKNCFVSKRRCRNA
jgi:hypothetical protein